MLPKTFVFPASPATLVINYPSGETVTLTSHIIDYDMDDPRVFVVLTAVAGGGARYFTLGSLDEVSPSMWQGTLARDDGGPETRITVRPAVPEDAVASLTLSHTPNIPMPIAVMGEILADEMGAVSMPKLWAMSDDEGFVATMMMDSDAGLYVRYSSGWHRITDPDVVDGLTVTEVDDAALDMYDQFDRAGQMVALSAMYSKGEPVGANILSKGEEPAPVVAAPAMARAVPVLASADDLEAAIATAEGDESLQWYVERRATALGLEANFPWSE